MSPHVKAPNGDIYDLEAHVASGLVNTAGSEWEYAKPPKASSSGKTRPKAGAESAAARRAATRAPKAPAEEPETGSSTEETDPPALVEGDGSGDPVSTEPPEPAEDPSTAGTEESGDDGDGAASDDQSEPDVTGEDQAAENTSPDEVPQVAEGAPAGNASTQAWADYASKLGIETEGLSRDQIREKVATSPAK